ncbi:MAG: hypothetical protein PVG49_02100 [Desulfobacteraceae bacterium]
MGHKTIQRWWIGIAVLLLLQGPSISHAGTQIFTGKAYNEQGGLEYIERHMITYDEDGVVSSRTTYFDPDERVIGSLVSEYAPLPQFCDYTFEDLRKQYLDGVLLEPDRICMFRKTEPDAETETVCLPREDTQIIGQGFHHFIVTHLGAIEKGEVYHVKLALPSRMDQVRFRIHKRRIEGGHIWIRLEVDNWVLRLFAPHIDVIYERGTGHLLRYEGISNIADASGECKPVRIEYAY